MEYLNIWPDARGGPIANADCYFRQSDGGTKTARVGSKTCFLRWFHNRSEAYFCNKSKEHVKTIWNDVFVAKTLISYRHVIHIEIIFFLEGFPASFLAKSADQLI